MGRRLLAAALAFITSFAIGTPPASATPCAAMNVFTAGTTANPTPVNQNFANLVTCAQNIDNTNIGSAGIYASQIVPTNASQATFGGSQTYTFPAAISGGLTSAGSLAALSASFGTGGLSTTGALSVGTNATVGGTLGVTGAVTAPSLATTGNATVGGTLGVTGAMTAPSLALSGNITGSQAGFAGVIQGQDGIQLTGYTIPTSGYLLSIGATSGTAMDIVGYASGAGLSILNNAGIGYMNVVGGTYTNSSDRRLKMHIRPLQTGLRTVMALRPRKYDWRDGSGHELGFIAQEVKPVLPDVVRTISAKGYLGINYAGIIPVLVKAVQEQQFEITELRREIAHRK